MFILNLKDLARMLQPSIIRRHKQTRIGVDIPVTDSFHNCSVISDFVPASRRGIAIAVTVRMSMDNNVTMFIVKDKI